MKDLDQGTHIQAGDVTFTHPDSTHRETAAVREAVEMCRDRGFLRPIGYKGEIFELTNSGYVAADELAAMATRVKD